MKDFGELKYFLGIELVTQENIDELDKICLKLIADLGLCASKPALTPLGFNQKFTTKELDKLEQ